MAFNYSKEKQEFHRKWRKLHPKYESAGMSEENIEKMKEFDWQWLCSRRRYENRTQDLPTEIIDDNESNDELTTLFLKFSTLSTEFNESDFGGRYGWVEEIQNYGLLKRLRKLSQDDLELLTLIVFDGYTQAETARKYGINQKNISKKMKRIKKLLI